jgi:hypothetical protein
MHYRYWYICARAQEFREDAEEGNDDIDRFYRYAYQTNL